MILDTSELAGNGDLSAEVCIVGAGAAGITLARRLGDAGLSVILLESGGFEVERESQALYQGRMSGIDTFELDEHRWRLFGGSTHRWAGFCAPLAPEDFERRAWIPHSGWPFGFEDLLPYYRRAQEVLELPDFDYDAPSVAARAGEAVLASSRLESHLYQFSPPTRFGQLYRPELASSEQVRVVTHANVTEIVLAGHHGRVARVECASLEGQRFTVEADRFVLATGGLENARLLLASNRQRPEGVANGSGHVGAFFMEHPHLFGGVVWLEPGEFDRSFYHQHSAPFAKGEQTLTSRMEGTLALTAATRADEGLPHCLLTLREVPLEDLPTGELGWSEVGSVACAPGERRAYLMTLRAEQTPWAESRATLGDETDALGMPRLDLRWQVRDEDLRGFRRTMEIVGAELAAAGLGRVWTPSDDGGRIAITIKPGGHHMGTTRMSVDPAQGVVDADGQTHEVDNLYLAGSSVFPTGGAANPTLTIVALAERLADRLIEGEEG